ncbi:Potassium voltage-gated channel Shaw, partial [Brachionus plicatilis]
MMYPDTDSSNTTSSENTESSSEDTETETYEFLTYVSVFFITVSILTFCFSTVNDLCQSALFCRSYNLKVSFEQEELDLPTVINLAISSRQRVPNILDYIEYICIIWFTIEFGIKSSVSPNKIKFFTSPVTWIDLLANIWFYIDLAYNYFIFNESFDTHPAWDLFGTIRIMRLFKLFNHYPGLRIIIASLKASAKVFKILIFFITVAVIIFASLIFYSEKLAADSDDGRINGLIVSSHAHHGQPNTGNQFSSIIEAIWFAVVSLTTVGFGDYYPKTTMGMVFGALCTVTGVLMIDLPMPIIVRNFANYYNHLQAHSKFPKRLRRKVLPVEIPRRKQTYHRNSTIQYGVNTSTELALITSRIK